MSSVVKWGLTSDSRHISKEAHELFANNAQRYAAHKRLQGLIAVFILLAGTWGMVFFFMAYTFVQAVSRVH